MALLLLRLAVGTVLAHHGWLKVQDVAGFAGSLESLGFPAPAVMAYLVTYLEFLGGIALIAGFATRYIAGLFVIEMVLTNLLVKLDAGLTAAGIDILILAIAISLMLIGAGRWSVDALLPRRTRSS